MRAKEISAIFQQLRKCEEIKRKVSRGGYVDEEGTRQHGDLHELRVAQRHAADGTTAGGGVLMA